MAEAKISRREGDAEEASGEADGEDARGATDATASRGETDAEEARRDADSATDARQGADDAADTGSETADAASPCHGTASAAGDESPYVHVSFAAWFSRQAELRRARNPRLTRGALAKSLGFRSPSLLSMIIKGERLPSATFLRRLARAWSLPEKESEYLAALVDWQRAKDRRARVEAEDRMRRLKPRGHVVPLAVDVFAMISDWYHVVALEAWRLKDRRPDVAWLARRLGRGIARPDVKDCLRRLADLGLLEPGPDGTWTPTTVFLQVPPHIGSLAMRRFHDAMLVKARAALWGQSPQERYVSSQTLAFKVERIGEAQEYWRQCLKEFAQRFATEDGDEVYHATVQFFRVTEP